MTLRRRTLTITIATLSAALAVGASASTTASAKPDPASQRKLDANVLLPFQVAVRRGTVWYTDGAAGTVTRLRNGHKTVVVRGGAEGVAVSGRTLAFTKTPEHSFSRLTVRRPGKKPMLVNLRRFERIHNPDGNVTYGIVRNFNRCAANWIEDPANGVQVPAARYKGIKDSHPYQVEALPDGAWAVAEAAGNEILRVGKRGRISVIARLPRQELTLSQRHVTALHAPSCLVGITFAFEPVPTDVERDRDGNLWVSTLPGGPEDASLGARGAVYKITRRGAVRRIHGGFLGATNLAVTPGGKVLVAQLFKGKVSTLRNGRIVDVRSIPRPVSVEVTRNKLFVGQLAEFGQRGPVPGTGGLYRFPR
jgi:hypothetical protein